MKKTILNLAGVTFLSRSEQKHILGSGGGSTCKTTCKDGSLVTVSGCSDSALACSGTAGGSQSCSCDYAGPFDPPKIEKISDLSLITPW